MPRSRKRPAAAGKERARRRAAQHETAVAAAWLQERLNAWRAPDGTILPPPRIWEPAGGRAGIRSQYCPRCGAVPGDPCRNHAGGETAEHTERVTMALRARGRDDVPALCGGLAKRGQACPEEPLPDDVYCRAHRAKASRGLPV